MNPATLCCSLLLFPCIALGLGINTLPNFVWEDQVAEGTIPLLRIRFQDGEADDFAVLKRINPIPQHAFEREEDIDACIFEGFLMNEAKSLVTVTGCPFSPNLQVQLVSKRVKQGLLVVENGQVYSLPQAMPDLRSDAVRIPGMETESEYAQDKQLAVDGYIIKVKFNYDDSWQEKFGADSLNAMRRVLAHAQNIWKFPSVPAKLYFDVDSDVRKLPGRWTASYALKEVSKNNVEGVNVNVYFTIRSKASGDFLGIAHIGGACTNDLEYKSAIQEWDGNDMTVAVTLAHEFGHSVGMEHDFLKDKEKTRLDSKGKPCTKVGGIMDYSGQNKNDYSLWSSCSNEDMTKLLQKYPECMTPATPSNIPGSASPGLTLLDCKMPSFLSDIRGVQFLKLNGYPTYVICISGLCAPYAVPGVTNACQYICGKDDCKDAVDPGVCDLKKQLTDVTGTDTICVNRKSVAVTCTAGLCTPSVPPYTNACMAICGSTSCETADITGRACQ